MHKTMNLNARKKDALDTFSAAFVFVYLEHDTHFVTMHFGETIV